jgi:hypothetical protein
MEVKEITVKLSWEVSFSNFTNTWHYRAELVGVSSTGSGYKSEADAAAACMEAVEDLEARYRVLR